MKLTAFCNLNCSYCYMFNLADKTYERVPRHCSEATAIAAVDRLVEHAQDAGLKAVSLVLHGGEPMLWPLERFQALFDAVERKRASGMVVNTSIQTNGLIVPRKIAQLLSEHDVTLGFSLDGPEAINDAARVKHDGGGSYRRVIESMLRVLADGFPADRVGVLSVVDPSMTPAEYFDWACGLPARNVSLLWPIEYSWDSPPWAGGDEHAYRERPRYGAWMAEAFLEWWGRRVDQIHVRQFLYTMARLMGQPWHSDSIGNDFVDMFVVNTDGGIEYPDYLRAHRDGGSRTRYSVHHHSLDEVRAEDEVFRTLLELRTQLPPDCRGCPNEDVCGGGFLAGRSTSQGFAPQLRSVLCHDQMHYFNVVRAAIAPYVEAMATVETEHQGR